MAEKELFTIAIGRTIKIFRSRYGWTQEKMEENTGLPSKAIGKFERGERTPSAHTLFRILNNSTRAISPGEFNHVLLNELKKQKNK